MNTSTVYPLVLLCLWGGLLTSAAHSQSTLTSPIDELDQAALQETFRVLRSNYIEREQLTLEELNRAALDGLLKRLDFGAEIVPLKADEPTPPASSSAQLVSETLSEKLAYLRPAMWTLEEVPVAAEALRHFASAKVSTLILDLRSPAPDGELATAARWLSLFLPADQDLFTLQKPGDPHPIRFRSEGAPAWSGKLALLFDEETNNLGEAVAAVLNATRRPPSFGTPTRGRTMVYQTVPLTPSYGLKFASAELRLSDGSTLFRKGLSPRIHARFEPQAKAAIFSSSDGIKKFVTPLLRPRHNEAALVTGTTPDLPYLVAKSAGQSTPFDSPPLQDHALLQVIDTLESQSFLNP